MAPSCKSFLAGGIVWNLTRFYGHVGAAKREDSWRLLQLISSDIHFPWYCFVDFNEIIKSSEKRGGGTKPYRQMASFQNCITNSSLYEIKTTGQKFTWFNKISYLSYTTERLDRALASIEGIKCLLGTFCEVLPRTKSDHSPLLINLRKSNFGPKINIHIFKYEAAWDLREEFSKTIQVGYKEHLH